MLRSTTRGEPMGRQQARRRGQSQPRRTSFLLHIGRAHSYSLRVKVRLATSVPIRMSATRIGQVAGQLPVHAAAGAQRPAQPHAVPHRGEPGDLLQHDGQLRYRVEDAREQEHGHDHEPRVGAEVVGVDPGGDKGRGGSGEGHAAQGGAHRGQHGQRRRHRSEGGHHPKEYEAGQGHPKGHVGEVAQQDVAAPQRRSGHGHVGAVPLEAAQNWVGGLVDRQHHGVSGQQAGG